MSDSEDRPERDIQERDTHKDIHFEWTPELVKIGTSRGAIHPSIGPLKLRDGFPEYDYQPGMALPDPADTRECLKWAGLSDAKIAEVEQKFNHMYPDYEAPSSGYDENHSPNGLNDITFPVVDKMLDVFIEGLLERYEGGFENAHEGFIEEGIKQGLQPKFAIFCGLHKDDPRAIKDPFLFEEDWFSKSPKDIIVDFIVPFWMQLQHLMAQKLIYEGKAWEDGHGRWLVHDGENMEQAKARVDDRERQRLRERAIEEDEKKLQESIQNRAREAVEDEARWAEEERQEEEERQKEVDRREEETRQKEEAGQEEGERLKAEKLKET